jgi:hypothetical protein
MNTNETDSSKNDRNRKWQTTAKMTEASTHSVPEEANRGSNYIVLLTLSEPNVVFTHIK